MLPSEESRDKPSCKGPLGGETATSRFFVELLDDFGNPIDLKWREFCGCQVGSLKVGERGEFPCECDALNWLARGRVLLLKLACILWVDYPLTLARCWSLAAAVVVG